MSLRTMGSAGRRSLAVAGLGLGALAVASMGVAAAADGGSLLLGRSNHATATTTLSDSKGTPLSLRAKSGKPPLRVNSSKKVAHLNADLLDGVNASGLGPSGSGVSTKFKDGNRGLVGTALVPVVSTGALKAGTYYINVATTIYIPPGQQAVCFVATGPKAQYQGGETSTSAQGQFVFADVDVLTVKAGEHVRQYCQTTETGASNAEVVHGGITAIRMAQSTAGRTIGGVFVN